MVALVALSLALSSPPSSYGTGSPFAIDPVPHTVVTASVAAAVLALQLLVVPRLTTGLACEVPEGAPITYRCPSSELNAFDRLAAGRDSLMWRRASDYGLAITFISGLATLASEATKQRAGVAGEVLLTDSLVVMEAFAITGLLTFAMKLIFRRPRPVHYTEGTDVFDPDAYQSFPSGHTSATSSLAAAIATAFWLRRPDDPARWAVAAGAASVAVFTGIARILGGRHFPTDVIAGFVLGAAVGITVPLLVWRGGGPLAARAQSASATAAGIRF